MHIYFTVVLFNKLTLDEIMSESIYWKFSNQRLFSINVLAPYSFITQKWLNCYFRFEIWLQRRVQCQWVPMMESNVCRFENNKSGFAIFSVLMCRSGHFYLLLSSWGYTDKIRQPLYESGNFSACEAFARIVIITDGTCAVTSAFLLSIWHLLPILLNELAAASQYLQIILRRILLKFN